jgi:hypothetical protein
LPEHRHRQAAQLDERPQQADGPLTDRGQYSSNRMPLPCLRHLFDDRRFR